MLGKVLGCVALLTAVTASDCWAQVGNSRDPQGALRQGFLCRSLISLTHVWQWGYSGVLPVGWVRTEALEPHFGFDRCP
jgi:hypothetical protein